MKLISGAAVYAREGVYHTRLRRLGTEDRWNTIQRPFESLDGIPARFKKHDETLLC